MSYINGKLVELPRKGYALIITDLHGNLTDFKRYEEIWLDFINDDTFQVIITGDFIHPSSQEFDGSINILESLRNYCRVYDNFHVLLGNHEWSHITLRPVYKSGIDQRMDFEEKVRKTFKNKLIRDRFANKWQRKMGEYRNFFESLPIAVKTDNKVFISHAGPSNHIKSLYDVIKITANSYNNQKLDDLLWKRYSDFTEEELNQFLDNVACNVHIVGHTIVDGIKIIGKKQLIISSSDSMKLKTSLNSNSDYYLTGHDIYVPGRKAYVMLDLEAEIDDVDDVLGMVKYL